MKKLTKQSSTDDVESRIHPIDEMEEMGTVGLFYGKPGHGKTAFGSTWPKPLLLLDIQEKGTQTIRKVPGIDRTSVDTWEQLEEVYWWLQRKKRKYVSLQLDQITQMQDLAMTLIKEDNNKEDDDLISKRMWGQISGKMKTMLLQYRDLRDMNYNVCFIAHERYMGGEDEAEDNQIDPSVSARLMPSLSSFVGGAVDIIGHCFVRERFEKRVNKKPLRHVEYCMRLGPHAYYSTKIRVPVNSGVEVPGVLVNPTL
jgi:hypothetical protein